VETKTSAACIRGVYRSVRSLHLRFASPHNSTRPSLHVAAIRAGGSTGNEGNTGGQVRSREVYWHGTLRKRRA
jgi:hypothetical protein